MRGTRRQKTTLFPSNYDEETPTDYRFALLKFDVSFWLKADIQSPEIEVRFTPGSGRSRDLGWTSGYDPLQTSIDARIFGEAISRISISSE